MKPVYFPFTCIYEPNLLVLKSFFKEILFYIPEICGAPEGNNEFRKSDFADVRMVKTEMDYGISMFCQEYINIGTMHGKGNLDYLKISQDTIPFRDEFSKDSIRSDIKKGGAEKKKREPLFDALAFLKISHDYDRYNYDIDQKIRCLDKSNEQMLKNLTRQAPDALSKPGIHAVKTSDFKPGQVKPSQRLTAWNLMYQAEMENRPDQHNTVFVTDSNEIFDLVLSESVDHIMLIDRDGVRPDHGLVTAIEEAFKTGHMEQLVAVLSSEVEKSGIGCYRFRIAKVKSGDGVCLPGGQRGVDILVCLIN